MAMKDWKKFKHSTKDNIIWDKGDSKVQVAFIREPNKWLVTTWENDEDSRKDKYFKTKSQALGFARQYMRTH